MKEDYINEAQSVVSHAQSGNWIPAAIVAGFLGLIILLLLHIYNSDKKANTKLHEESAKRHIDNEMQLRVLTDIAAELKADKDFKDREIKEIKANVKTNTNDIKEIYK